MWQGSILNDVQADSLQHKLLRSIGDKDSSCLERQAAPNPPAATALRPLDFTNLIQTVVYYELVLQGVRNSFPRSTKAKDTRKWKI